MFEFFAALFRFSPLRVFRVFFWTFISSALEGVGLLLLLPLLTLTNIHWSIPSFSGPLGLFLKYSEPLRGKVPLWSVLIIYVGLVGLLAFLNYARTVEATALRLAFCKANQNQCHEALLRASLRFHTQHKLADHAQVLTAEVMRLSGAISQWIQLASALGLVAVYSLLAFLVSWKMTLIIMLCSGVAIFILNTVSQKILSNGHKFHQFTQSLYSEVLNHLNGLKEAKSLCIEPEFQKSFEHMNQVLFDNQMEFSRNNAVTTVVYQIVAAISLSIIFGIAYWKVQESWVNLTLLLMLFVRMIPRVSQVHTLYHSVMNLYPSYQAIVRVKNGAQKAQEELGSPIENNFEQRILRLNQVGLSYGDKQVLKNISCELNPGTLSLIIGPSGGGKSSFCDLISGLIFPSEGEVFLGKKSCGEAEWVTWRRSVAYFTQVPFLIAGTLRENLCLGNENYSEDQIESALKQAGALDFIKQLPEGLNSFIGDRGVILSGGQRQRVALARILLKKPKLLILDEVCAHLDAENINWIRNEILKLKINMNMMIVVVSHDQNKWIENADQVFKIEQGCLNLLKPKLIQPKQFESLKEPERVEHAIFI